MRESHSDLSRSHCETCSGSHEYVCQSLLIILACPAKEGSLQLRSPSYVGGSACWLVRGRALQRSLSLPTSGHASIPPPWPAHTHDLRKSVNAPTGV